MQPNDITPAERTALAHLVNAWNAFIALPVEHPSDQAEFCALIHNAEARILMRPTRRALADQSAHG